MSISLTGSGPSIELTGSGSTITLTVTTGGGSSGGVTDHGALTGLSDDDHSQYALADGTRGTFAATTEGVIPVVWFYRSNVADLSTSTVIVPSVAYLPAGALVLFDGQSTSSENGLYEANGTGGVDVSSKINLKVVGYANRPIHAQVVYDERDAVDGDLEPYLSNRVTDDTNRAWFLVQTADGVTYTIEEFKPGYEALTALLGVWFPPAMDDYSISYSDMDGNGDYQLGLMHGINVVDTTSGNCNLILGPHATMPRHCYIWHRQGSNSLTVENLSGDGDAFSYTVEPGEMVLILPDGAAWHAWPIWRPQGKGDLQVGTADRTAVRLPVGTDGHVLTADSGENSGVKWAAIPTTTYNEVADAGSAEELSWAEAPDEIVHDITMTEDCAITFGSASGDNEVNSMTLILRGAFTPTLPASVDWAGGSAPTYGSPSVYEFVTVDNGTTVLGFLAGATVS